MYIFLGIAFLDKLIFAYCLNIDLKTNYLPENEPINYKNSSFD
jgi:hypothetical protein